MNKRLRVCVSKKVIEGEPIRVAYRERSQGQADSGWRLLSGTEDELYAVNPDNVYMVRIKELLIKFPELEPVLKAKTGSLFKADDNGKLILSGVDKKLTHVEVRMYFKPVFISTTGTKIVMTADVDEMRIFNKKKRNW
ncbi:MAG: DUF2185 domain-containing protein [Firmicutes bacterium]|nr:DUF2185 domain-containing protein [Lachnospiraceae bacterium]MBQ3611175.1 DUF2185 domain-containing protein [Bacillota bacterium]